MLALQVQQMEGIFPLPPGLTLGLFGILSFAYVVGAAFNVLLRAGYAARSKVNVHGSRLDFLTTNWDTILVRVCMWGFGAFYFWSLHPTILKTIASGFNMPDWLSNWMIFPVNVATSAAFGFFIDVALDSLQSVIASKPFLAPLNVLVRGRVPVYDSNVVDVQAVQDKTDKENK